uniref:Uncharacterized protein n=1 Tax=Candidatus Kentrum sp. LFY TaxID=2126342 RepID=A0A450U576_9GAMM|nr:MAG: hypothetical protein BECKLFY1418B_GA0070995_100282 [Candidatus Kentron sp. LFY]
MDGRSQYRLFIAILRLPILFTNSQRSFASSSTILTCQPHDKEIEINEIKAR